jgi:hypothetical protein
MYHAKQWCYSCGAEGRFSSDNPMPEHEWICGFCGDNTEGFVILPNNRQLELGMDGK